MSKNTYSFSLIFTNFVTNLFLFKSLSSHAIIGGAAASLWTHPVDVLTDILDVAGLAVDAVGGVNDQLHHAGVIWLILVHAGGAELNLKTEDYTAFIFMKLSLLVTFKTWLILTREGDGGEVAIFF